MRPSLQARFFSGIIRSLIRRRDWGDENHLARRARRLFGAPLLYRSISTAGLDVKEISGAAIKGEWIAVRDPEPGVILYVHGGGFVSCSAKTHRPITSTLARMSERRVLSINYRLAPENRYPAAIEDVMAAYEWLISQGYDPSTIALAGDSAGGNLVLLLATRLRDANSALPACILAFSPWTDLTGSTTSVTANDGRCAMFRPENLDQFAHAYLGGNAEKAHEASTLFDDGKGLPPVLFHVGSTELLLDDSRMMHERILAAGGESHLEIYKNVPHCWQMLNPLVPEANESLGKAAAFVRKKLQISFESM